MSSAVSGAFLNWIWPGGDSFVILQPHFISHLFMRGTVRKISLLMTVVFAIFVCGNTLFIHTHSENGQTVTHSHPYLPGQAHHHSANAFQCIGAPMRRHSQCCHLPWCAAAISCPDLWDRSPCCQRKAPVYLKTSRLPLADRPQRASDSLPRFELI